MIPPQIFVHKVSAEAACKSPPKQQLGVKPLSPISMCTNHYMSKLVAVGISRYCLMHPSSPSPPTLFSAPYTQSIICSRPIFCRSQTPLLSSPQITLVHLNLDVFVIPLILG